MTPDARALRDLARLYGIQATHRDGLGQRRRASSDVLLTVLRALGAPVERMDDARTALEARQRALWQRRLEPVGVAWDGESVALELRLPAELTNTRMLCALRLEHGHVRRWTTRPDELPIIETVTIDGERFDARRLVLPGPLPSGYHTLALEVAGSRHRMLIISAPRRAYVPPAPVEGTASARSEATDAGHREGLDAVGDADPAQFRVRRGTRASGAKPSAPGGRGWGVFLPLYALHSERSWGTGDFSDLEALAGWVAGLGGDVVATLPLLSAFLDAAPAPSPFEPSPYMPVSRRFWNELFVDVERVPELDRSPEARALIASTEFQRGLDGLRRAPLVDYAGAMALKRRVLETLSSVLLGDTANSDAFTRFRDDNPRVDDYARFRATCERRRAPWPLWPARLRGGRLEPGDYDEAAHRYHVYVQWLAHRQLDAAAARARAQNVMLYLDLPLGVHPDGYDVWRERARFAPGVSGGAPPDAFFTGGQDWGFPPLRPDHMRECGYDYTIAMLRHHLRFAGVLRLDHVMGLHRLFWVPNGFPAREGVYVRYPAAELYAVLSLESHRHRALIVGEDLGTVPVAVRRAMARHAVQRMHVVEFELAPDDRAALRPAPAVSVASIETHDMPPFAAFWDDQDIERLETLGLLGPGDARHERGRRRQLRAALVRFLESTGSVERPATPAAVLRACLAQLGAGQARLVLVNLEDLWLETEPQNVPGTSGEYPNWRRKARYNLEELGARPDVVATLLELDRQRAAAGATPGTPRRAAGRPPRLRQDPIRGRHRWAPCSMPGACPARREPWGGSVDDDG